MDPIRTGNWKSAFQKNVAVATIIAISTFSIRLISHHSIYNLFVI